MPHGYYYVTNTRTIASLRKVWDALMEDTQEYRGLGK